MITEYDDKERRCPRLGHQVSFLYCREESAGLPCRTLLDCWFELLPVRDFVNSHYSEAEREKFTALPQSKMTTIVDLIEKARQAAGQG